jgi:O-antigen ligase
MNLMSNTMKVNETKIFDWVIFSYILVILLTRQVPYHQIFSYGSTALLLIVYVSRKLLYDSSFSYPAPIFVMTVGCYLFTVFISLLFSDYLMAGFQQLIREVSFFLILFVVYDYVRGQREWQTIVLALVWCGGLAVLSVCVEGLYLFFSGGELLGGDARVSGLFSNPNVAGLLISVCFPVTLGFLQWKQAIHMKNAHFFVYVVLTLTFAAAILTVSRGLLFGFFFSVFILYFEKVWKIRYRLTLVIFSSLFFAVVIGLITVDSETLSSFNVSMRLDRGLAGRGFIWERAWQVFTAHPLLGTGPSTFLHYILSPAELRPYGTVEHIRYMYFQHGDMSLMHVPGIFSGVISNSAHNLWLDTAANTGIIGVVAVSLIFLVFGWLAIQKIEILQHDRQNPHYWVIKGCLVGVLAFFLRSQFEVSGILRGALSESLPFWLTFVLVITIPQVLATKVHSRK